MAGKSIPITLVRQQVSGDYERKIGEIQNSTEEHIAEIMQLCSSNRIE